MLEPQVTFRTLPQSNPVANGRGMKRRAIFVLGMHRSGTSALARVLGLLGAALPKRLLAAAEDNPTGYWEPSRLVLLHQEALASAGLLWHSAEAFPADWIGSEPCGALVTALRREFEIDFGGSALVAIKDPRLCRLVRPWLEALDGIGVAPLFVIAVRNPLEVSDSLRMRDHSSLTTSLASIGGLSEREVLNLWMRYFLEAERHTRPFRRVFVTYDQLLDDWRKTVERIGRDLGVEWPRSPDRVEGEVERFLSSGLRHHTRSREELVSRREVSFWVKAAYAWALSAAENAEPGPVVLDRIAHRHEQRLAG
jgi:hypothetical protein